MREKIYTEVATFISQNETRPVYLLNLFKQMKNLQDNQSRYKALKSVYDINIQREMENEYDDDNDIVISAKSNSKYSYYNRKESTTSGMTAQSDENDMCTKYCNGSKLIW